MSAVAFSRPVSGSRRAGKVLAYVLLTVFAATALPFPGALPAWKDRFG